VLKDLLEGTFHYRLWGGVDREQSGCEDVD
jgi:hypothetical protein